MKHLIPAFTFILGIFVTMFFFRPTPEEPETLTIQSLNELESEPGCETTSQSENSQAALLAKEELVQAKRYYGKAFKLFLLNIGTKITAKEAKELGLLVQDPTAYIEKNPNVIPAPGQELSVDVGADGHEQASNHSFRPKHLAKKELAFKQLAKQGRSFQLEDPALYFARSQFIKEWGPQIQAINGDFVGKLYWFDKGAKESKEPEDIEIHVSFVVTGENKIDGEFQLLLSRGGETYSNNRGSGGNGDIKIHPDDPNTIIIEASPNSFFHGKVHDLSVLNYYYDGKHVGVAHINSQ